MIWLLYCTGIFAGLSYIGVRPPLLDVAGVVLNVLPWLVFFAYVHCRLRRLGDDAMHFWLDFDDE